MPTKTSLQTNRELRARVRELDAALARVSARAEKLAEALREAKAANKPAPRPAAAPMVRFAGPVPACADPEDFERWRKLTHDAPPGPAGFCEDCYASHQERMIKAGRCENPDLLFARDTRRGYVRCYKPLT